MRVGLVIYGSLDTVSGGYLYDRQLVRYLRDQGDEVEIISLPWRSYGRHLLDNGSTRLRDLLCYGGYDVVVQDELNHPSLFWLNNTIRDRPAPFISLIHHLRISEARPAWQNALYGWVEGRYLASVDAFIINSWATADAVSPLLERARSAVIVYPGRDHLTPPEMTTGVSPRAPNGPLRVLFVGNVIRRKGLHVLLAALAQLPAAAWSLDIVGDETLDPRYTTEIAAQIDRLPRSARVTRHGRIDNATLAARYAAADVLVVPSSYEGYGIVYAEALGFGLPVIATNQGGATEIVTDGISGYLVSPNDPTALAERLAGWVSDRALLATMAANALDRYQELPTWAESGAAIRRFLESQIVRHQSTQ